MTDLMYTFSNEDTETELQLLNKSAQDIMIVAGSGSRVLPLFFTKPKNVYCVDTSINQLYLTELRIEAVSQLEYEEFLILMGYVNSCPKVREALFRRLDLTKACRDFNKRFFEKIGWGNLIFSGIWEQDYLNSARKFNHFFSDFSHDLSNCSTQEEQSALYKKHKFKLRVFSATLRLDVFKIYILGFLKIKKTHLSFRKIWASKGLFFNGIVSSFQTRKIMYDFFYSILFTAKYNCTKAPTSEVIKSRFYDVKNNIKSSNVYYINEEISSFAKNSKTKFDFVSLSNVTDYLDKSEYMHFMQKLKLGLSKNARVVLRQLFPMPKSLNTKGFKLSTAASDINIIQNDKTPFYKTKLYINL